MQVNVELGPLDSKPPRKHSVDLKDIPAIKKYAFGQLRSTGRPYVLVSLGSEPGYLVSFRYDYEPPQKMERHYDKSFIVVEPSKKVTKNA